MHFRHSFPSGTAFGSLKSESSPPLQVPISKVDVRAQCITAKWDLNRAVMFHDSMNRYSRMGIKQKFQMILNRNVNSLNWFSIHLIHQINQQYTKMNESWRLESPNHQILVPSSSSIRAIHLWSVEGGKKGETAKSSCHPEWLMGRDAAPSRHPTSNFVEQNSDSGIFAAQPFPLFCDQRFVALSTFLPAAKPSRSYRAPIFFYLL